ncbi:hybrid sensory histidine kinase BarA [Legionella massiliensis]|uniref:Hybrid sensory histidine kinase BarA n=1 Tax=Legionella massiliensis TaxID=1034943 RepID=A0A078KYL5_9GAMM|nr:Hpt domain-containing protein [Legionella massiliensis]CDZ78016.1 hybrid sensory histidine kinase BarA [Legionella massiliensis]CEE13754.1 hybrid sensory histidine kinase BarA [Legionella massiliensis]
MRNYAADLPAQENLFNLDEFPLLDADEAARAMGSKDILLQMLDLMLNQAMVEDLSQMKAAHGNNDWDKTQQIAHKIKGGAVYVGAVRMKMACQYLERYWKTGQRELLEQLYEQTLRVIDDSLDEIRRWLASNEL